MSMKDSTTSKYCSEKGGLLDSTLTPTSSACSIAAEEYIEDCNDALARLSATENSSTVSSASESDIGSMKEQHKILKARNRSQSIDLKKQKELTEDQEKIVEKQKNMLLGILNASFDALFVINDQGIIQQVNKTSTRVFGYDEDEFVGNNISIIMTDDVGRQHDQYLENYMRTGIKKMIGTQREVTAQRKDKSTFPCILGLSQIEGEGLFCGFIRDITSILTVQKRVMMAEAEREAADSLLHNVLPEHIAHRLKVDPGHIADHYDNTTICFADICGFTDRATKMTPHDVVAMLNDLFSRFDKLVDHYGLNKVKTIGDCYMVTSIPSNELTELDGRAGCQRVCRFALDLLKAVTEFNMTGPQHGQVELRVGIAIGSVVAGVVGTHRFLFDMWGDAVNVAARMEQLGVPSQIQVTREVVDSVSNDFSFECRGKLDVKGKGLMETYLLKSAKDISRIRRSSVLNHWKPKRTPPASRANSTLI